jgi:hypothetical protein
MSATLLELLEDALSYKGNNPTSEELPDIGTLVSYLGYAWMVNGYGTANNLTYLYIEKYNTSDSDKMITGKVMLVDVAILPGKGYLELYRVNFRIS